MGKNPNNKIIISIPCGTDNIKAKTAFSLVHALRDVDFEYDFMLRMGCDLIGSRTGLVRMAQKAGGTHILFVDHDMFFPCNGGDTSPIKKLLDHDKDIVGVAYNFRSLPLKTTAIPLDTVPNDEDGRCVVDPANLPQELFKCKALGTGFLLIKLSVFDKLPEPWFQFRRNNKGELLAGEDTYFCQLAIANGFDVWADPTLTIKHLGEFFY